MKAGYFRTLCSGALPKLLFLFIALASADTWASHFRGGSITWQSKALGKDGVVNDVEITVKIAWNPTYTGIKDGNPILFSLEGDLVLDDADKQSDELIFIGGDTSATADYALQTTIFHALDLTLATPYDVYYTSNARINELQNNAGGPWRIQTRIYLKEGNLAPKIDLPIIMEVPQLQSDGAGGTVALTDWTYDLSSTDPNADKLRYRLANCDELGDTNISDGCSYSNPTGLAINPNTGVITWVGSGSMTPGLYSAGIVAEDVDENGNSKSKTHVDLILSLVNKQQITYTNSGSIPETRNVIVEKGQSFSFNIAGTAIDTQSLGTMQGALTEDSPDNYTFAPGPDGTGLDPRCFSR